jgi:hypothetical protein
MSFYVNISVERGTVQITWNFAWIRLQKLRRYSRPHTRLVELAQECVQIQRRNKINVTIIKSRLIKRKIVRYISPVISLTSIRYRLAETTRRECIFWRHGAVVFEHILGRVLPVLCEVGNISAISAVLSMRNFTLLSTQTLFCRDSGVSQAK